MASSLIPFYKGVSKFPDCVDNKVYAYKNKNSLRSNIKGYGGKNSLD